MGRWRRSLLGIGIVALFGHAAAAQVLLEPPPIRIIVGAEPAAPSTGDLPIVNTGFANDQDVSGPIAPLVKALQSSIFSEREEANLALLRLPPGRLDDVVKALAVETDAEAIERLTRVAAHLYLKPRTWLATKPSLLGVWFQGPSLTMLGVKFKMDAVKLKPDDPAPTMTVMVTEIQPGFPAMQTLRNGDRIVAVGGIGFPLDIPAEDSDYFRTRVAELWPGGVAPMTILRDGKLLGLGVQTTGLPLDGPSTPTAMVNRRTAALNAFLETLKTGDKSQVRANTPTKRSVSSS